MKACRIKVVIYLLVEDQTPSYLKSMEITPQEKVPLINLQRSQPFWLKDPISLKSPRKKDKESEVQLSDRRTGSSETGALPQRFGKEPSETRLPHANLTGLG